MQIAIDSPQFTQKQVAACTLADMKTLDNYIQHGFVMPTLIDGRRMFCAFQMIEIHIMSALAAVWKIPPKTGWQVARQMLVAAPEHMIERDADSVSVNRDWVNAAPTPYRAQFAIERLPDGVIRLLNEGDGTSYSVEMIVPLQVFVRHVLANARHVLDGTEPVGIAIKPIQTSATE